MTKLKSCPFCGMKPDPVYCGPGVYISCCNDDCPCTCEAWGENEDRAKEAWNTRAADAENAKLLELVVSALRTMTGPRCDDCVNEWSCRNNLLGECVEVSELRDKARELGIEEGV